MPGMLGVAHCLTDSAPMLIELTPPDISPYQTSASGVDYVQLLDSGRPGPTVMVQALTHGNELCGAIALDWLFKQGPIRPLTGRLILCFANVQAYQRFDPADPSDSRFVDEDLNRVWADDVLFGPGDSAERRRARQLQPFVDSADFLLDIHSMQDACRPLMVCGLLDKGAAFARELGMPGDLLIDSGHPSGLRMRDRGGFGDPASPKNALLIECGQHWERSSAEVAIDSLVRFLRLTGMVDEALGRAAAASAAAHPAAHHPGQSGGDGAEPRLPLPQAGARLRGDRQSRHTVCAGRRDRLQDQL